ncbi:hypothetical protein [Myxococcus landrumensis]|uniref:3-oxoacyl-ACP synthase n=1 Tax=Myxococcus landrumensis TaxID=2813577 RepID=A0ABX7N8D5_9BACT|nr:hypothetical protein [Myxococcus landrumus]QSQ14999.1 hypothetical protein JY572_02630 [Myxococcus landrumus]
MLRTSFGELGLSRNTLLSVYPEGNAAGLQALAFSRQQIQQGGHEVEIIIGVDSLLDVQTLSYLAASRRLKQATQPRGAIPGEACVGLALTSERIARQAGLRSIAFIEGLGLAAESILTGQNAPLMGEGLTRAIGLALEDADWSGASVLQVNTDLNGEVYRAHEWMLALVRTLNSPHVVHPADCIGDVGAAFAPLLVGMAATAFQRGYARGQRLLVSCSSDSGLRGACAVAPAS